MDSKDALVVFEGAKIRRTWHDDQWFFSVVDIIQILTDSGSPRQYRGVLKKRDTQLLTICLQLKLPSSDGKYYNTDCVNTENAFRLIQSIPSKKAEPFKRWLAKVGYERIQEIENPELAQDRVKDYYELKGYPADWIEKRLRGIAIRQDLTDEWKYRGIQDQKDFAILMNEISKATFGKTVGEYKEFKSLKSNNQNLRDHTTDWWFSIIDGVEVLVGGDRPRKYWNDLKKKLLLEGYDQLSEKIGQLKIEAYDKIVLLKMAQRMEHRACSVNTDQEA